LAINVEIKFFFLSLVSGLGSLPSPSHPLASEKLKVTIENWGMRGNLGKYGEILGLGERRGFTKSPLIPKPLVGGNTLEINKASGTRTCMWCQGSHSPR
jgi:hypothetical protein